MAKIDEQEKFVRNSYHTVTKLYKTLCFGANKNQKGKRGKFSQNIQEDLRSYLARAELIGALQSISKQGLESSLPLNG